MRFTELRYSESIFIGVDAVLARTFSNRTYNYKVFDAMVRTPQSR